MALEVLEMSQVCAARSEEGQGTSVLVAVALSMQHVWLA